PGNLEEKARSGRRSDDFALPGHRVAVDRAARSKVRDPVLLDEPANVRVLLLLVACLDPVVAAGQLLLPVEPDLAAALGQEVLFYEAVRLREFQGAGPDEKDAIGPLHDQASDLRWVLDVLEGADRAGLHRAP